MGRVNKWKMETFGNTQTDVNNLAYIPLGFFICLLCVAH
jgi:hypothetical protein